MPPQFSKILLVIVTGVSMSESIISFAFRKHGHQQIKDAFLDTP